MYDERLGTDWVDIGMDEVVSRAYALGVSEYLGDAPAGELERLRGAVAEGYDRSLVDLAYREGLTLARKAPRGERSEEAIWRELTAAELDVDWALHRQHVESRTRQLDLPESIRGRSSPETAIWNRIRSLDLPSFLR